MLTPWSVVDVDLTDESALTLTPDETAAVYQAMADMIAELLETRARRVLETRERRERRARFEAINDPRDRWQIGAYES